MTARVYNDRTIFMNAISLALTVPTKLYLDLNGSDILLSGIYFIVLLLFAQNFSRLYYLKPTQHKINMKKLNRSYSRTKKSAVHLVLLASILTTLTAIGLSFLSFQKASPFFIIFSISMIISILSLNRKSCSIPFQLSSSFLLTSCLFRFDRIIS